MSLHYLYTGWLVSKRQTRTAWIWLGSPYKNDPYVDNKTGECGWIDSDGTDYDDDEEKPSVATGRCHQPTISPTHDLELGV